MKLRSLFALVALSCAAVALAKSPFDGTWTISNPTNLSSAGTFSLQDAGNGALKYHDPGQTFTLKLDGTALTTATGEVVAMRQTGDGSYTFTSRRNGKLLTDERWTLSGDGHTLTIDWKTFQPNGKTYHSNEIDARTSPGNGLSGTWKITKLTTDLHDSLVIETSGSDEVTFTSTTAKSILRSRWDGRDYPPAGPLVPAGLTVALSRSGARAFTQVIKRNGKILRIIHYTLSSDGRSMSADATDAAGKAPSRQFLSKD